MAAALFDSPYPVAASLVPGLQIRIMTEPRAPGSRQGRAAFEEWQRRAQLPQHLCATGQSGYSLGTHLCAVGRPTIWQRSGVWDLGSNELKRLGLEFLGLKRLCLQG